ncbi:MAG: hypothetical protein V1809_15030 [Planctomycetota bacterium]
MCADTKNDRIPLGRLRLRGVALHASRFTLHGFVLLVLSGCTGGPPAGPAAEPGPAKPAALAISYAWTDRFVSKRSVLDMQLVIDVQGAIARLGKEPMELRRDAGRKLVAMGSLAINDLLPLIEGADGGADADAAGDAAEIVSRIGDLRAVDPLIRYLDKNPTAAQDALGRMSGKNFGADRRAWETWWADAHPLIERGLARFARDVESGNPDRLAKASGELGSMGGVEAAEVLIPALRNRDRVTLAPVMGALVRIGAGAVPPLLGALTEEDLVLRRNAIHALGMIRRAMAIADPTPREKQLIESREGALRYAVMPIIRMYPGLDAGGKAVALQALGGIGDPRAKTFVQEMNDAETGAVRIAAQQALVQLGDDRPFDEILSALSSPEPAVRVAARAALKEIARRDFGDDPAKWRKWWEEEGKPGLKK